jgi:VanZ family protein
MERWNRAAGGAGRNPRSHEPPAAGAPAHRLRSFHRPHLWVAVWLALVALVVAGSLLPAAELPTPRIAGADKVQHFIGYAALAGYAVMLFERARGHAAAAVAVVLLGVAIEFAQGELTQSRRADAVDVLANAIGALAGWALRFTRMRHALQRVDRAAARVRSGAGG